MEKSINKNTLAKELARRLQCTDVEAKAFIRAYNSLIIDKVSEGCNVKLQYFGSFVPSVRPGQIRRNPLTGEKVEVEKQAIMKFKPSECVLRKLNDK